MNVSAPRMEQAMSLTEMKMKIGVWGAGAEGAEDKASWCDLCFGFPGTPLLEEVLGRNSSDSW